MNKVSYTLLRKLNEIILQSTHLFQVVDGTMDHKPFNRNFGLIPVKTVFKHRKVSNYSILCIENTVQKA